MNDDANKLIEFPMLLRGEQFNSLTEVCTAYGLNTRFVANFYASSPTIKDALLNAMRYKDVQSIYGITLKVYTGNLAKLPKNDEWERKTRVIKIQRNMKIEEFNQWQHEVVKAKFEKCITNLKTYIELRNKSLYNKNIEQEVVRPKLKKRKRVQRRSIEYEIQRF